VPVNPTSPGTSASALSAKLRALMTTRGDSARDVTVDRVITARNMLCVVCVDGCSDYVDYTSKVIGSYLFRGEIIKLQDADDVRGVESAD